MSNVCFVDDDYVREIPRWVATLDDGTTAYGDDDRPGVDPPSAWARLRSHCLERGVGIANLRVQFRSNFVDIPRSTEGYFFSRTASAMVGSDSVVGGFKAGFVNGDQVHIFHFRTPDLSMLETESRSLDRDSPSIILNR